MSTRFKALVRTDDDSELADQLRKWYDLELHGEHKEVERHSTADARTRRILED